MLHPRRRCRHRQFLPWFRRATSMLRGHFAGITGGLVLGLVAFVALLAVAQPSAARAAGEAATTTATQRTYRVGVLTDNDPFSFVGSDGIPQGFAVDLLSAIENTMGLRFERVVGPTNEINTAFRAGRLDLLQSFVRSPEREAFADFSVPYLPMAGTIFARRGEKRINSFDDLRGRRVLVHRGSVGEQLLVARGFGDVIVQASSVEDAFRRLEAGEADATLAARLTGLAAVRKLGLKQVMTVGGPIDGYKADYRFAVREGDTELLAQLNEGLASLQRSGEWDKIYNHWFGNIDPTGYDAKDISLAIAGGLLVALAVALWALARQRILRNRIATQAEELRLSEERFRGLFESSLDGVVLLSGVPADDVPTTILEANPTAHRLLGVEARSLVGRHCSASMNCDLALLRAIAAALAPSGMPEFEHRRSEAEGAEWLRVSVARIGGHVLVNFADITAARAAEERLRQAQKLEAIGTLAAGIAHDFNNILTSILGNAELARLEVSDDHPARASLDEILRGSDRARILVRQILAFSRRAEAKREIVRVSPLVEETLRFLRAAAPTSIELRHVPTSEPPLIIGDPTQLHQVLMNLCTNAVHALRDRQGRIEIAEETVVLDLPAATRIGVAQPGAHVKLIVRDTGCGMPPEVLERIFEPFFTTKAPGEGTGLGLAVVHGIVRAHDGAIEVASEPGRGTEFRLYFPLAPSSSTPASEPAATAIPVGNGQRVLFIDDEPAITQMARVALTRLGYDVITHCNPVEALAEFERGATRFDLVFTDLTMPQLSGIDVAGRVQRLQPSCPVVLASGFLSESDLAKARAARVTRLIDKPLSYSKLGVAVADGLRANVR